MIQAFSSGIHEAYKSIWSDTPRSELPKRVLASIRKNDELSEVLVKLIQFAIFAIIGALYFAAPAPNPETVSKLPLVLGLYLLFTVILLIIAVLRAMPAWLVYLSIIIDMGLLTYLIFSFHIQYDQEASFSLKDPAILNYFVLIGLRALRFEARYVFAAGVTAMVFWAALVGYVVFADPVNPMITRDYVTYLTSNSVLIGAEIAKLFSIGLFTVVLAIAVRRAHAFLVGSLAEGSAAEDLARFMPQSVAETIRMSDQQIHAGDGVRREAAVLNVDIRGFTSLVSSMPPDDTMRMLSDYQHRVIPIVHRHDGIIDKFMGDGIMATFGASHRHESHCASAIACAMEILESLEGWKASGHEPIINCAIASGPVVFGAVGDDNRLEYTVIGPAVNASAKLEKCNKWIGSKALCDKATFECARNQGYKGNGTPHREPVSINGDGDQMEVIILA